ncbi:hypothetical protein R5R35_010555 [Gryllus longicercus]|uniref:BPTI/Kunitz inhibitor domain-containing protein n=1 Tax=Gryllus longicercus TaxID=2509291 RepID=A0AAN9V8X7_9ORTH
MQLLPCTLLVALAGAALAFTPQQHGADAVKSQVLHAPNSAPTRRDSHFYDAVVVEAEGRAEGAGGVSGAGGALPQPLDEETCSLEPEQGPCRGYFSLYHYDAPAQRCRQFTYSGCGGNANRFRTQKACEAACGHLGLPGDKEKQPHRAQLVAAAATHKLAAAAAALEDDAESVEAADVSRGPAGDCSWGHAPACPKGCYVVNDARTDCPRCECSEETRQRVCSQPAARGHCRALLTRWRFDPAAKDCVPFRFGGCDGNANNFASRQQCLDACAAPAR